MSAVEAPPTVLALLCIGAAAGLCWPSGGESRWPAAGPAGGSAGGSAAGPAGGSAAPTRRLVRVAWLGGAVLGLGLLATPRQVVLGLIVAAAGRAAAVLLRRRREARAAQQTTARLLEACEQLTGELVSGQPPGAALEHCAGEWPALAPVAEAFRVGADVPAAWREAAQRPGAGDLRLVAAAWQVSHRTGSGLAAALEHLTADLRAQRATRRVVAGELASARATARLVAGLPVLALTFGTGTGGDPWGFLLGHPVGLACLALGLAFALAGLAWIEALAREVDRP